MQSSRLTTAIGIAFVALTLSACGGGGGGGGNPPPVATPTPSYSPLALLVPGTVNQRTGTQTVTVTFASPSATNPNSNASYTLAETDTISTAASGAPAPIDIHRVQTWTTVQPPSYGVEPTSNTFDDYESVVATSSSQTVTLSQAVENAQGINEGSILANGGSGAFTQNTTTTYSPAQTQTIYPLVTGASFQPSQARVATTTTSTAAASGTLTSNLTTTFNADDSFTQTGTGTNGDSVNVAESSNGSASVSDTGPVPFTRSIGVPTNTSGSYVIPVTTNGNATTIADYYPGNALPPAPLGTETVTVTGPVTSLPSGCSAAASYPNIIASTTTSTVVNVVDATVTTSTATGYNSNGLGICRTSSATTYNYSFTTGAVYSTTVTNATTELTSSTVNAARARAIRTLH